MTQYSKNQSNPFSTGGGGVNFETRVQAAFATLMLSGHVAPCIPNFPIIRIKLQGRYLGYNTDDFIVFSKEKDTGREAKLFAQIKHEISFTESSGTFAEVIDAAWKDFNHSDFNRSNDAFSLITGPLSSTDIKDVRPILEWARHSDNETEFLLKVNSEGFSSEAKRKKLKVFRKHLTAANSDKDISDKDLWEFLKTFHLLGYDLDTESGTTLSLLQTLISKCSTQSASSLWARIVDFVQTANQNAGTITFETIPTDVLDEFSATSHSSDWYTDIKKLQDHGRYILEGIRSEIGNVTLKEPARISQISDLSQLASFIFVSGERGAGKSSLIRTFIQTLGTSAPVFCIRAEDLDKPHLDNVFTAIGLKESLRDLEAGFSLMPKKYLFIESLEKVLELEHTNAFTDLLQFLAKHPSWTVIATGRDYAYQQISFNFLQPFRVHVSTLTLDGFSDEQLDELCIQLEPLGGLSKNPSLKPLLKNPFFADLAWRVLQTGTTFTEEDGEKGFRVAVWRDVIAKESERVNGLPLKRKQAFIQIAVKRAKQMVYGVPENEFDSDAVLKLEKDNLIRRDLIKNLVSPAHDVLEDWAIEQHIEDTYQQHIGNEQKFLDVIGHEPSINRAFRLWLNQKLKYGENVNDFVCSILKNNNIQKFWQDETIAAVLLGNNPHEFLDLVKDQLFIDDGELLKKFCFILRIACQTPDQSEYAQLPNQIEDMFTDIQLLKPYGKGWEATISFLLQNKLLIPATLTSHIAALLNDWTVTLNLSTTIPTIGREVGLLAMHLLAGTKDKYRDEDQKKLVSIILKTSSVIAEEFSSLLERNVFISNTGGDGRRPRYADELCKTAFSFVETAFLSRFNPDILIKLAWFEWFIQTSPGEEVDPWYSDRIDVAECFGLHEYRYEFSPASGAKGPFQKLLSFHSRKGLDFILEMLNKSAEKYAHSDLDAPHQSGYLKTDYAEVLISQVELTLNDGSTVCQYSSSRLWVAYRGLSVVPDLLQSALMALENWLVVYTEIIESDTLEWLFNYILKNSNSVMTTAVLASVATGFPEKLGKFALPILNVADFYGFEISRIVQERGGNEINWHKTGFNRDPYAEIYSSERHTAALRPWRQETLETLVTRLQFAECKADAFAAIDKIRANSPSTDSVRFLLHRIDSRGWTPILDEENNRIVFESKLLEPDLVDKSEQFQTEAILQNRFTKLYLWARKTFSREPDDKVYYANGSEVLAEAKELLELAKNGLQNELIALHLGGIVVAAAVLFRDHKSELSEENAEWAAQLVFEAIIANAHSDDTQRAVDITDIDGAAASAYVIPILLDFTKTDDDKLAVKKLIVLALTHPNENVRHSAAEGIKENLWGRDPDLAQYFIMGTIKYASFEQKFIQEVSKVNYLEAEDRVAGRHKLKEKRNQFREQFALGKITFQFEDVTLKSHSAWHILSPFLMIPDGSTDPDHVKFISNVLDALIKNEKNHQNRHSNRNETPEIHYEFPLKFTRYFAKHLYQLLINSSTQYLEQLKDGCDVAPSFISHLTLSVAVVAEKSGEHEVYWMLWEALSGKIQDMALKYATYDSTDRMDSDRRQLIRRALQADIEWQQVDIENQNIRYGKDLILKFVKCAGKNIDVFESLAKLINYFPSIFYDTGIKLLAKLQKEEGDKRLLSGVNSVFYLERSIQRYLRRTHTGPLSRDMHESCLILLDAIVETGSSRAYYLREHLIRSRRIL